MLKIMNYLKKFWISAIINQFLIFADDQVSMIEQGIKINNWGKNVRKSVGIQKQFTGKAISKL